MDMQFNIHIFRGKYRRDAIFNIVWYCIWYHSVKRVLSQQAFSKPAGTWSQEN